MSRYVQEDIRLIGSRLKSARNLTTLNQVQFCKKHGLSLGAVKTWEAGKFAPRRKNLEEFCLSLQKEGVLNATPQWFLENKGPAPAMLNGVRCNEQGCVAEKDSKDADNALREADLFKENQEKTGREAFVITVADDAMAPYFFAGDMLGGVILKQPHNPKEIIKRPHLLQTRPGQFTVRWFLSDGEEFFIKDNQKGSLTKVKNPIIAKIVWCRSMVHVPESFQR